MDAFKKANKRFLILVSITIFLFAISLPVMTVRHGLIPLNEVFENLIMAFKVYVLKQPEITAGVPNFSYIDTVSRLLTSFMCLICGGMLSASGFLYQSVFKNPVAAPSVLGISAGTRLGIILYVIYSANYGSSMIFSRYQICYAFSLLTLFAVLFLSKISSRGKGFSVWDTLIIAVIFSALLNAISSQLIFQMENDQALAVTNITNIIFPDLSFASFKILIIVFIVTIFPFFLMRFSFNAVIVDDGSKGTLGINTGAIKILALILGALMLTSATIHIGSVGMISLIAPFISRNIFSFESKKMFFGNILIGANLLLIAKTIAAFIPFGNIMFPSGSIIEFLSVPIFILIVKKGRFAQNEI
jgi:iron complex transport system permease protein